MTTKQHSTHGAAIALLFCVGAAFVAFSLGTTNMGPVGTAIAGAIDYLAGPLAWAVPFELIVIGLVLARGAKLSVTSALVIGDAVLALAAVMLFRAGVVGEVFGDAVRSGVGTLGTALIAITVAGMLGVSRTSLMLGLSVRGARAVFAQWMATRGRPTAEVIGGLKALLKGTTREQAQVSEEPRVLDNLTETASPTNNLTSLKAAEIQTVAIAPLAMHTPRGGFALPSADFLAMPEGNEGAPAATPADGGQLIALLSTYGIEAQVERTLPGPTVTTFEVSVAPGTKLSKLVNLEDELALALGRKVRVVPARANRVGFEVPNDRREAVNLRSLIEDEMFQAMREPLPIVLGRDMQGAPVFGDLAAMPHVIVAGASGSGKSVGLNVMLASLLCKRTPEELRFIMIDPKVVELAPYDRIPHMLLPVVTDMKQAAAALKWAVNEMERRYQLFATAGTKNITSYNAKATGAERLPFIVIVVDEFADLIMQQGKEVESAVVRLGQKARAAGMHMILATQRPSVDVITGTIKANFSSRIAYRVAQSVDSRTILDEQGAEHLLGAGDMLVKLNGASETRRVQCPMISEDEIGALATMLRAAGQPTYNAAILRSDSEPARKVRVGAQAMVAS